MAGSRLRVASDTASTGPYLDVTPGTIAKGNGGGITITAPTGVTVTPTAGQPALVAGGDLNFSATDPVVRSASSRLLLYGGGGGVLPGLDGSQPLGDGTHRWSTVYAVAGTINTSSRDAKEGITPLDPARAMEAVRNTEAVTFDYVAPERPEGVVRPPGRPGAGGAGAAAAPDGGAPGGGGAPPARLHRRGL